MRIGIIWLTIYLIHATEAQYYPLYHYSSKDSPKNVITNAVNIQGTNYLLLNKDEDGTAALTVQTTDFFQYSPGDPKNLPSYNGKAVGFIVFDNNTAAFGVDHLIAVQDLSASYETGGDILHITTAKIACSKCVDHQLALGISANWDSERKRWVSAVNIKGDIQLATSLDLKKWTPQPWLQGRLANLTEIFQIQSVIGNLIQWVLVFKQTDDGVRNLLHYTFFSPDDIDQKIVDKGILCYGPSWKDASLVSGKVSGNSLQTVNIVGIIGADYKKYSIDVENVVVAREYKLSGNVITQLPARSILDKPGTRFLRFSELIYLKGDDPFACLCGSRSYKLQAEFDVGPSEFGFELFVNPKDKGFYAGDFTYFRSFGFIQANRYYWLPGGQSDAIIDDPIGHINVPYASSGAVKLLALVDQSVVEVFADDGKFSASFFTFPDPTWDLFHIYANQRVVIRNLELTIYDNISPKKV